MPLSKLYNIAELGDMAAEAETRIQVATVQAMVRRIFQSDHPPGVDEFDCIIVDEAHRGYTLDQDMTEGELAVRDQAQYLSSYRRTLDYFDAVKIGLTATPAKHTTDIFGKPVYTYSYREAVADDWLIDHEPPIRYETLLTQNGIQFEKGQAVSAINLATGEIEVSELEDEISFNVESFNKGVITEGFNRVICQQLAEEIDPLGDEKTMIFCATDLHADMVKRLLDDAFRLKYGEDYNEAAVRKITGALRQDRATDQALQKRALPQHCDYRRPAHDRHRRAENLPSGLHAPRPLAHPVRANDRPRHPPLRRDRQNRVQDLRSGRHLRGAARRQHHAAAGERPRHHARTAG